MSKNPKVATPAPENQEIDLEKSLDENLEKMNEIIKSKDSNVNVQEMLKTEDGRKKLEEALIKAKKKPVLPEDEDEEEEEEEMDGEDDEDEEKEEEEEEMKGKKKSKGKIKKSASEDTLENFVNQNDEIIDAVPVFKSFCEVVSKLIGEVKMLKSKVDEVSEKVEDGIEIQKSFANVVSTESQMIKSINEVINKVSKKPAPVKGVINKSQILSKSFGGDDEEGEDMLKSTNPAIVKNAIMKAFESGKVSGNSLSKWEMSRYNVDVLTANEKAEVQSIINGGK